MTNAMPQASETTQNQLERAEQIVATLAAAQQKSNRLTVIFCAVSLVLVSGYFYYVHQRLSDLLEPESMVELAQDVLERQWPEARDALESHVRSSAPDWAAQLSQQAREAIPQARLYLQDYALARTDELAESAIQLSEERVREYVSKQRPLFEETFRELAKDPESATARLTELRMHFEDEMDADFLEQTKELLQTVELMNDKLATLRAGENLTPEQELERRVLMLARRLQADHLPIVSVTARSGE